MIKKSTLFFSSYARDLIRYNEDVRRSPGLERAMLFPHILVSAATKGGESRAYAKSWGVCLSEYLINGESVARRVADALKLSQRVEAWIRITNYQGPILLDISFYGKNQKTRYFHLQIQVNVYTGETTELTHTFELPYTPA